MDPLTLALLVVGCGVVALVALLHFQSKRPTEQRWSGDGSLDFTPGGDDLPTRSHSDAHGHHGHFGHHHSDSSSHHSDAFHYHSDSHHDSDPGGHSGGGDFGGGHDAGGHDGGGH